MKEKKISREIFGQIFIPNFFYSSFKIFLKEFFSNFTLYDYNLIFLL